MAQDIVGNDCSFFDKAVLVGLCAGTAAALFPEAVISAAGSLTVLTLGVPMAEGMALDAFANAAFMKAATRAGAIVGGGKVLNLFGVSLRKLELLSVFEAKIKTSSLF